MGLQGQYFILSHDTGKQPAGAGAACAAPAVGPAGGRRGVPPAAATVPAVMEMARPGPARPGPAGGDWAGGRAQATDTCTETRPTVSSGPVLPATLRRHG